METEEKSVFHKGAAFVSEESIKVANREHIAT